jgi:hypothetical protein
MKDNALTLEIQVPTTARLVLLTQDGVEEVVTPAHLRRLGYIKVAPAYQRFCDQLTRALDVEDISDVPDWANLIRYMAECALHYDHDYDYSSDPDDPLNEDTQAAIKNNRLMRSVQVAIPE